MTYVGLLGELQAQLRSRSGQDKFQRTSKV